ncbi:ATP-binding protein [Streptomyces jumonjinensis]|uniref:ATP-binding protein n=2 Tax=Streptomyces jumonjinensis TaxID=1945 RepID=A0A646KGE5_STRJU|nr:ATP-binding protein [Streptomyces jumonjinensis]MQT01198.1 ATP-binding protein [Streptomyces jumonjinensis]
MSAMAETGSTHYRQELTAHPRALARIRRIIRAHLRHWGLGSLTETAVLCAHELLANVDKHTDSPRCVLTLERRPGGVRVVVRDTSARLPVLREPDWVAESGRGMALLESMADSWGAAPAPGGKDVWCEIRAEPGAGGG